MSEEARTATAEEIFPDFLERAIRIAVRQHEGQLRKGDRQPFVTHPIAVALLCARAGLPAQTVAAALLHDVVEDTDMTGPELAEALGEEGEEIARTVLAVTKAEGRLSWEEKSRLYLERLRTADREALAVAAADKIHNLYALILAYGREGDAIRQHARAARALLRGSARPGPHALARLPLLPELDRQLVRAREALL